jgi:hypothetical protein
MRLHYHNQPSIGSAVPTIARARLDGATTADLI